MGFSPTLSVAQQRSVGFARESYRIEAIMDLKYQNAKRSSENPPKQVFRRPFLLLLIPTQLLNTRAMPYPHMAVVVAAFMVVVGFKAFEHDVYVVFFGENIGEVFNQF